MVRRSGATPVACSTANVPHNEGVNRKDSAQQVVRLPLYLVKYEERQMELAEEIPHYAAK